MDKVYEYNNVSNNEMKYYIQQILSSIFTGSKFPVSNKPSTNRFIHDFYKAYMQIMLNGNFNELPRISRIKTSAKSN